MNMEFDDFSEIVFVVVDARHGVPEDFLDLDLSLAPPLGSYDEVKRRLAKEFDGIEWDDQEREGRLDTEVGNLQFSCREDLIAQNFFTITAPEGTEAYVGEKLGALGFFAIGGGDGEIVGGDQ